MGGVDRGLGRNENGQGKTAVVGVETDDLTLLETAEFIDELRQRIPVAKKRILVQLMTFDGDKAGLEIAALLSAAAESGIEVLALVDQFALRVVSDQSARKSAVADELLSTKRMFEQLRAAGVQLKFTHPFGPVNLYSLTRNHKKIFVIDDDAYLGGVNVSDHNFEWRDFMVKIGDPRVVAEVVADFDHTFNGGRRSVSDTIVTNEAVESLFDSLVLNAKHSVVLASPYAIDVEFFRLMGKSSASTKTLISPRRNNIYLFRAMTPFINDRLTRSGVKLLSYRSFSHAKFLLVDDDKLLIGSSNFGRHSFWCNQEVGLLITDPAFIKTFKTAMLDENDLETVIHQPSRLQLIVGAVVSYWAHSVALTLRSTIASRVPNLSSN